MACSTVVVIMLSAGKRPSIQGCGCIMSLSHMSFESLFLEAATRGPHNRLFFYQVSVPSSAPPAGLSNAAPGSKSDAKAEVS